MKCKKRGSSRGGMLIEVMVSGALVATASLGAAAALISGLTLAQRSERTLSEVATAENVMERIRIESLSNFAGTIDGYRNSAHAGRDSTGAAMGEDDTQRRLSVTMPIDEALVPGAHDLNGDGEENTVDPKQARILVVDVNGSDRLRLRTAIINTGKLSGISLNRRAGGSGARVGFGETREALPEGEDEDTPTPPSQNSVEVSGSGFDGKSAVVVLNNVTVSARTPKSITIAPGDDRLYFEKISLGGTTIFTPDGNHPSGIVTIALNTAKTLAAGEADLAVGGFFKLSPKLGKVATKPDSLRITVAFDDGSVVSVNVRN